MIRDWRRSHIDTGKDARQIGDARQPLLDERRVEVVEMQMHIVLVGTVPAAFPDLDGDGAGDHVARGEVLGRRRIALHEFLAG